MNRNLIYFLSICFTISWLAALWLFLSGNYQNRIIFTMFGVVYMFIPLVSALLVQHFVIKIPYHTLGFNFKINKWWFIAWGFPIVLALLTFGISLLFPGITFSMCMEGMLNRFGNVLSPQELEQINQSMNAMPVHPFWIAIFQALIAGCTINAFAAFGEEVGWRGFMYQELKDKSFITITLITGSFWGLWHAPLILMGHNYPQHPIIGVFMMIIWCILLSAVFHFFRIKTGSVIVAAILHGSINASYGLSIMLINGGNDLTIGLTGLAGFIALIGGIIVLYLFNKETFIKQEI
jgi:uncharacterized protein